MTRTNINVPDEDWQDFRVKGIKTDRTANEMIVQLIKKFNKGEIDL